MAQLELDRPVEHAFDLPEADRSALAGQHADQLRRGGAVCAVGERRQYCLERLTRLAPCENLLADEPDRLARA